jgi:hypothetical protein
MIKFTADKIVTRKLWAGIVNGRLDMLTVDDGWGGFGQGSRIKMPALFKSRALARERYQSIKRVTIVIEN